MHIIYMSVVMFVLRNVGALNTQNMWLGEHRKQWDDDTMDLKKSCESGK
jgi:hypothetical protein